MLAVFEDLTAEGPLVVLIEDAQWLDGSTAKIVTFLAAATCLRGLREQASIILLEPIGRAGAAPLLDSLDLDLRPSAQPRLLAEAGGNPLAVREFAVAASAGDPVLLALAANEHLTSGDRDQAVTALDLTRADLDMLYRADLVRTVDGEICFRQPVLRSVVYGSGCSGGSAWISTGNPSIREPR